MNGRTSWNSSTGGAVWFSQNYEGWFFGPMNILGQDAAALLAFGVGNNSCFYNISSDQWQYYNSDVEGWTYVNDGDVSIQCLTGNFKKHFSKMIGPSLHAYSNHIMIYPNLDESG